MSLLPSKHHFLFNDQLNITRRSIVINWMLAVVDESYIHFYSIFKRIQTHHRCVSFFDRYCCNVNGKLKVNNLQKLGAACVLLALGLTAPEFIDDDLYDWASDLTDNSVSARDICTEVYSVWSVLRQSPSDSLLYVPEPCIFNVNGARPVSNYLSELWPSSVHLPICRKEDTIILLTCMKMLQSFGKDNVHSCTFWLTHYMCELALQVKLLPFDFDRSDFC